MLGTADTFLASPGVAEVPPKLADALEELRAILAELREGGAATNVNNTLASASRAADAVTAAADDLPALMAELNGVADRADAALATVSPGSQDQPRHPPAPPGGPRRRPLGQRAGRRTGAAPNSVLFGR